MDLNEIDDRKELEKEIIEVTIKAMVEANINPVLIYAFKKTGMLMGKDNIHLFSDEDIEEWNQAVEEYEAISESVQNKNK